MSLSPDKLQGLRILVAEDEAMILMEIEDMLHDIGCEIVGSVATVDAAPAAEPLGLSTGSSGPKAAGGAAGDVPSATTASRASHRSRNAPTVAGCARLPRMDGSDLAGRSPFKRTVILSGNTLWT